MEDNEFNHEEFINDLLPLDWEGDEHGVPGLIVYTAMVKLMDEVQLMDHATKEDFHAMQDACYMYMTILDKILARKEIEQLEASWEL